jgi:UDP-glucose 4-epimerase
LGVTRLEYCGTINGAGLNIVLLGGAGFIGRHLRDALNLHPHIRVTIASHTTRGVKMHPREVMLDRDEFETTLGEASIGAADALISLRSASIPMTFVQTPWREIDDNVAPAFKLLDRVVAINPRLKFIYASSGGTIYGQNASVDPVRETTPLASLSAYGLGKAMIEEIIQFYHRTAGLKYAILRISNPVGIHASSNSQGLVPAILRAHLSNRPVHIFGDGANIRDYLSADDVAQAIMAAAASNLDQAIFNVGSGTGRSILDVVDLVSATIGRGIERAFLPKRDIDLRSIVLDCSLIETQLGWRATTPLSVPIEALWHRMRYAL